MALSLKKFREIVFQLLYTRAFEECEWEGAIALVMKQNATPKSVVKKAAQEAEAVWGRKEEIDQLISLKAESYEKERLPRVELSILRLGLYELLHTKVPPKVAISEGVRIAKKFATPEGATFVNALLDAVYKEQENAATEKQTAQ